MVNIRTTFEHLIGHDYTKLEVLLMYYLGVKLGLSHYRRNTVFRKWRPGEDIWAYAAEGKEDDKESDCTMRNCVLCCLLGVIG